MTLRELSCSPIIIGTRELRAQGWDAPWRKLLLSRLELLCRHLWSVGVGDVFVDGSFATNKLRPGDIDGYFVCDFETFCLTQLPQLLALDAAWDLSRRSPDAAGKVKPLMWHQYRIELFPHFLPPFECQSIAANDADGSPLTFPEFFRRDRENLPRGILRIRADSDDVDPQ